MTKIYMWNNLGLSQEEMEESALKSSRAVYEASKGTCFEKAAEALLADRVEQFIVEPLLGIKDE